MDDKVKKLFRDTEDSTPSSAAAGRDVLTGREQEVLALIAQGRANKEIADLLTISIRTVETHRAKIMRKLDIHSHAGLIYYAMRRNISDAS